MGKGSEEKRRRTFLLSRQIVFELSTSSIECREVVTSLDGYICIGRVEGGYGVGRECEWSGP